MGRKQNYAKKKERKKEKKIEKALAKKTAKEVLAKEREEGRMELAVQELR